MKEVQQFLADAGTFFVATVEEKEARVRPFGFSMIFDGKLYFCTGNQKPIYRQLQASPVCEICACKGPDWVRIRGKAVFDKNLEAKKKAFEISPMLAGIYGTPDGPQFEVFYLAEAEATFSSMTGTPPRTVRF